MTKNPTVGGEPQKLGECTECGKVYPMQIEAEGELRPIGTDGRCTCGNSSFQVVE